MLHEIFETSYFAILSCSHVATPNSAILQTVGISSHLNFTFLSNMFYFLGYVTLSMSLNLVNQPYQRCNNVKINKHTMVGLYVGSNIMWATYFLCLVMFTISIISCLFWNHEIVKINVSWKGDVIRYVCMHVTIK